MVYPPARLTQACFEPAPSLRRNVERDTNGDSCAVWGGSGGAGDGVYAKQAGKTQSVWTDSWHVGHMAIGKVCPEVDTHTAVWVVFPLPQVTEQALRLRNSHVAVKQEGIRHVSSVGTQEPQSSSATSSILLDMQRAACMCTPTPHVTEQG